MSSPLDLNPYAAPQSQPAAVVAPRFPLGAMSLLEILKRAFAILCSRFFTFFSIELISYLPLVLLVLYHTASPRDRVLTAFDLSVVVLAILLETLASAAVLKVVEQEHLGRRSGIVAAWGFVLSRAIPLVVTTAVFVLVVSLGLILFIIPGLLFFVRFVFAPQACVLEDLGPIRAMNRSGQLTQGFRWRVAALLMLLAALNWVVSEVGEQVLGGGTLIAGALSPARTNIPAISFLPLLLTMVINAYGHICLTLTYFDLRVRHEGVGGVAATRTPP